MKICGMNIVESKSTVMTGCSRYDERKPQTNADKLRAMSDEELAEFLANIAYDIFAMYVSDPKKMWLDWLREAIV